MLLEFPFKIREVKIAKKRPQRASFRLFVLHARLNRAILPLGANSDAKS